MQNVNAIYADGWIQLQCTETVQDLYLYINDVDWILIKAEYLIKDISVEEDGSTCALMMEANKDSEGNELEQWDLGIPAMQGLTLLMDTVNGISIARNDGVTPETIASLPTELVPLNFTTFS